MLNTAMTETQHCHLALGTEVTGLDLRQPLSPDVIASLSELWMERLVLVFPGQEITDEQHIQFGREFGELEIHPSVAHRSSANPEIYRVANVDEHGELIPAATPAWQYINQSWLWHSDSSFREIPSNGSILHGIEVTDAGGRTRFANLYAAYETLPKARRDMIDSLSVVHDHEFIINHSPELRRQRQSQRYDPMPAVTHPLVRVHPVTQRRSLFISPHTMASVVGYTQRAGRALLDELIEHATAAEFVYEHVWSPHDIVMWDNRCTMHSVQPFDNRTVRRIMHRVTLVGTEKPAGAGMAAGAHDAS